MFYLGGILRNHGHRRKPEAGFTLVEMIIVVAIIAVLSAILSVGIRQIRASYALRRAATIATAEVRRAHASTVAEGVNYTVEFVLANPGSINVYRAKLDTEQCPPGMVTSSATLCTRSVGGDNWPPKVQLQADSDTSKSLPACSAPASPANKCVTFGLFGAPVAAGDVLLVGETGQTVRIVVEPATGRVSAQ